jgi:lysophospholipase L1-like esterase
MQRNVPYETTDILKSVGATPSAGTPPSGAKDSFEAGGANTAAMLDRPDLGHGLLKARNAPIQLQHANTANGVLPVNLPNNLPKDTAWKVVSDQPWARPYVTGNSVGVAGGEGEGAANVMFLSNPGREPREATLTIFGPNGEVFGTQKVVQPPSPSPLEVCAVGDSYMAGTGASGARDSTADAGVLFSESAYPRAVTDGSTRAENAWPRLFERDLRLNVHMGENFFAYLGATTDAVDLNGEEMEVVEINGKKSAPSINGQITGNEKALRNADIVLLTAGGNDVLFADLARACTTLPLVGGSDKKCAATLDDINTKLELVRPKLEETYKLALEKAPNATIYISGYPFASTAHKTGGLSENNEPGVLAFAEELNKIIQETVDKVNRENPTGPRLVYMPPIDAPDTLHGVRMGPPEVGISASFHPNDNGNQLWAEKAVECALSGC